MKFDQLLMAIADEPVFETGLLLAGDVGPLDVRRQLSRWVKSGRLLQLRRGLYALAPPYQKIKPHPFLIANRLVPGSYVSLQTALSYHGLIPEGVTTVTSIATGRSAVYETPLGRYEYHHIKPAFLQGFRMTGLGNGQEALIAVPEKAILDLAHLTPGGDNPAYLRELRLQGLEQLCAEELRCYATSPKLRRVAEILLFIRDNSEEYREL